MMSFNNLAFELFVPKTNSLELCIYIGVCILLGIGFLFALTRVPKQYRKPIVVGLTFVLGFVYLIEFMVPGRSAAPIRSELKAAQGNLNIVQQDLYAVIIGRGSRAKRIDHAQHAIDIAINHLDKADTLVKVALPKAEKKAKKAYVAAEKWAESHKLKDPKISKATKDSKISYLRRDSQGNIDDVRTQPLTKYVGDLNGVKYMLWQLEIENPLNKKENFAGVVAALKFSKAHLSSSPQDALKSINKVLKVASDAVGMSSSSVTDNFLSPYMRPLSEVTMVIGTLAFALGLISLSSVHGKAIIKVRPGWINSLAFFVAIITITVTAFLQEYLVEGDWKSMNHSVFMVLFDGALKSLSATMFSLVAFYIVSAAYRSFRIKSTEAALMMAAAFVIMLALVPFGAMITNGIPTHGWLQVFRLEKIGTWILNFPNAAAQRGMMFGIGIGGLAMALRLWLSLERGSYFDKEM